MKVIKTIIEIIFKDKKKEIIIKYIKNLSHFILSCGRGIFEDIVVNRMRGILKDFFSKPNNIKSNENEMKKFEEYQEEFLKYILEIIYLAVESESITDLSINYFIDQIDKVTQADLN